MSGIAGISGCLAFGLQGDVMGGLPGASASRAGLLGFHGGIAGGLLSGSRAMPGSVALGSARITSDADSVAGGLSFGECWAVCPGSWLGVRW